MNTSQATACPKCGKTMEKVSERDAGEGFFKSPENAGNKMVTYRCVCGTTITSIAKKNDAQSGK